MNTDTPTVSTSISNSSDENNINLLCSLKSEHENVFTLKDFDAKTCPFLCDSCELTFNGLSSFYEHRRQHMKYHKKSGTIHNNDMLSKKCFLSNDYDAEMETEMLMTDIYDQCRNFYKINKSAQQQQRYECLQCGEKFKRRRYLDKHLSKHLGAKPYVCIFCDKKFTSIEYLSDHLKIHYLPDEKQYKCDYCSKTFYTRCGLKHHRLVHTAGKRYKCSLCDKSFFNMYSLNYHLQTHANEKLYKCSLCPKKFNLRSTLNQHIREHVIEPLTCKFCQKKFVNKYYFVKHEKAHVEKQTFPCDLCPKVYAHAHNLRAHRITHFAEKQIHRCEMCSKTFNDKYSLKYHCEAHYAERMHTCKVCQRTFIRQFQLNHHIRYSHKCEEFLYEMENNTSTNSKV